jgi:hypothetical protein
VLQGQHDLVAWQTSWLEVLLAGPPEGEQRERGMSVRLPCSAIACVWARDCSHGSRCAVSWGDRW